MSIYTTPSFKFRSPSPSLNYLNLWEKKKLGQDQPWSIIKNNIEFISSKTASPFHLSSTVTNIFLSINSLYGINRVMLCYTYKKVAEKVKKRIVFDKPRIRTHLQIII